MKHNVGYHAMNLSSETDPHYVPNAEEAENIRLYNRPEEDEYDDSDSSIMDLYGDTEGDHQRGLPQGLPTSPILTVTALEKLFIKKCP